MSDSHDSGLPLIWVCLQHREGWRGSLSIGPSEHTKVRAAIESLASRRSGVNGLATDCSRIQGVCGLSGAVKPA